MSPWYGLWRIPNRNAAALFLCSNNIRKDRYYTSKALECYTTTYAAPRFYTDAA
jgi:hypothetical protein